MSTPISQDADFVEPSGKANSAQSGRRPPTGCVIIATIVLLVFIQGKYAYDSARSQARRISCSNHLKQIFVGLSQYEATYGTLPPAYTVDAQGRPLHSWRTLILPYMEESKLYEKIDLTRPWNDPVNARFAAQAPGAYRCPTSILPADQTCCVAIVGPNAFLLPDRGRRLTEITDPRYQTIALLELDLNSTVSWMSPVDANPVSFINFKKTATLPHPGGLNIVMADGQAYFMKLATEPRTREALTTVAGKESVSDNSW